MPMATLWVALGMRLRNTFSVSAVSSSPRITSPDPGTFVSSTLFSGYALESGSDRSSSSSSSVGFFPLITDPKVVVTETINSNEKTKLRRSMFNQQCLTSGSSVSVYQCGRSKQLCKTLASVENGKPHCHLLNVQ